jgi:hypothetical protein
MLALGKRINMKLCCKFDEAEKTSDYKYVGLNSAIEYKNVFRRKPIKWANQHDVILIGKKNYAWISNPNAVRKPKANT